MMQKLFSARPGLVDANRPAIDDANSRPQGRRRGGDRGSSILEFTGFLPLLLFIAMAVIQLGLVGYSYSQAGSAARAGARAASQGASADLSARASMSDWLADQTTIDTPGIGDTVTVRAKVEIPTLIPFADFGWEAEREVTMPADE